MTHNTFQTTPSEMKKKQPQNKTKQNKQEAEIIKKQLVCFLIYNNPYHSATQEHLGPFMRCSNAYNKQLSKPLTLQDLFLTNSVIFPLSYNHMSRHSVPSTDYRLNSDRGLRLQLQWSVTQAGLSQGGNIFSSLLHRTDPEVLVASFPALTSFLLITRN